MDILILYIIYLKQYIACGIFSGFLSFLIQSLSKDNLLKFEEDSVNNDDIFLRKKKIIKNLTIQNIIFLIILFY